MPVRLLAAAVLAAAPVLVAAPAAAQTAATPADAAAAGKFVDGLSDEAFAILRDKSMSRSAARAKFRSLLKTNFAVDEIGARLIRRHRATLTPAQVQQYRAIFPDWVVGTYADRLYDYANSDLKVVRTLPRGQRGDVDVMTRISLPGGGQPIDATWSVKKTATGAFVIQNLTVAGVNLSLTQEADFTAYIQKNGFDGLLKFMRDAAKA
jgi:phospholipid transport system substrate-binding protein